MITRFRRNCRLVLGIMALSAGIAVAQSPNYNLYLSSGTVLPPANLIQGAMAPLTPGKDIVAGRYYRLLQFFQIPTKAEKAKLQSMGVTLLEYMPSNAYAASIDSRISPEELQGLGIRAIVRLDATQKIRRSLQELPLPAWAVNQPGTVDVEMTFPTDLPVELVVEKCIEEGLALLDPGYPGVLRLRVPAYRLLDLADAPWVSYLEPLQKPAEPENYTGRTLHRSNVIASDHASGRHYDGTGVIVAMGDDGIIGPHIDFEGRADQSRVTANNGTHGDHVAGTIFGAGNLNPKNKGMAFGATLHVYQVWAAVNDGANANATYGTLFTSTSYSDGCNGGYTSFARSADLSTYNTPTLLHVFSAGNEGTTDCGYGAGAGWGNVTGGVKIGKNVLAVASLNSNGTVDSYSSRGPAEDGRIKPEVGAKGGNVSSTYPDNTYFTQSGTSMACPGASGTLAQLAHAYRSLNGNQDPPSALMKAVLMNGADDKGNPGPDFKYGFGEMNALRSVVALENQTYFSDTVSHGESDTFSVNLPAGALLKVMVYWHDAPGSTGSAIPLVNNLDLEVIDPTNQSFQPWILNHLPPAANLNANATRGRDSINNVEQVTISAAQAGTYKFVVEGYQIPTGPQGYHLVYELRDSAVTLTYPIGGETWAPGETEKLRWDSEINPTSWALSYSSDSGATWTSINANVTATQRHLDWAVPSTLQSGKMMVRVEANGGGPSDESDHTFSVIRVPANLTVLSACPTYITLRWDSLATANGYDVFMLGPQYMDSIGTTTNRSFTVTGTSPNQAYWFAVRSKAADGAVGRRTVAIYKAPGISNCSEPNDVGISGIPGPGSGVIQTCALDSTLPITVKLQNISPNAVTNIPISYQLNGGPVMTETFTGTLAGNSTQDYNFTVSAAIPPQGIHTLRSWTEFGQDLYKGNDTSSIVIEMQAGAVKSMPYAEDFETFGPCSVTAVCENASCSLTNDWLQGTNESTDWTDWRTDRGGTPTSQTGPTVDHNPGTNLGNYLYVEGTSCEQQTAMLYTPCLDLGSMTNPYFSFWFNQYGADMGDLHVDIFSAGKWNLDVTQAVIGNWGMNWWERQINLSTYAGQTVNLRFRAITGNGELSDMAIDDVKVTEGPPVSLNEPDAQTGLSVFPNPGSGKFAFVLTEAPGESIRLSVKDLAGRLVVSEEYSNFSGTAFSGSVDISAQPTGIYLLELETESKVYSRRIALMR